MPVKNAPYAVAKTKSEKILCLPGFDTLTTAIPVRRTKQLSWRVNWQLVICS